MDYDKMVGWQEPQENGIKLIADILVRNKINSLLDIGTGTGNYILKLKGYINCDNLVGFDISPNMLKIAKTKDMTKQISWIEGDILNSPFENNSFDAIIGISMLSHINRTNTNLFYKEIHRILKPNGIVIFPVKFQRNNFGFGRVFLRIIMKMAGIEYCPEQESYEFIKLSMGKNHLVPTLVQNVIIGKKL